MYRERAFINCPFDEQYKPLFEAIVFAISACGLHPRCALEIDDASEVRIDKIFKIIADCKYGIHDISRTEVTSASGLPRFNMPLELGVFLAAKRFGVGRQQKKVCLILDSSPYRYQQFISDIAGQDIQVHGNDARVVITVVRNWLRSTSRLKNLPGGAELHRRFQAFEQDLPTLCENPGWNAPSLPSTTPFRSLPIGCGTTRKAPSGRKCWGRRKTRRKARRVLLFQGSSPSTSSVPISLPSRTTGTDSPGL